MWSPGLVELPSTALLEKQGANPQNSSWEETWPGLVWQAEVWSPNDVHAQFLEPVRMLTDMVKWTLLTVLRWGSYAALSGGPDNNKGPYERED